MRFALPFTRTAKLRRMLHRGEVAFAEGDLPRAEGAGRSLVQLLHQVLPDQLSPLDRRELSVSALELTARVRRELGDLQQAADLHRRALVALDDADNSTLRAIVLLRLGETLRLLGRYTEAERHHSRAVALVSGTTAEPMLLAAALNGLGIVFKDTGRFADAASTYQEALVIAEREVGPDGPQLADLHHNLAGLNHAQDRFVEGEPHAHRALELRHMGPGLNSTAAAGDLAVLGALLLGQDRYTEAEQALEKSLAIWVERFGPNHYEVAIVKHNLAALYTARGEYARAEDAYRAVHAIKHRVLGEDNTEVIAMRKQVKRLAMRLNESRNGVGRDDDADGR